MRERTRPATQRLAALISRYLARHPAAADDARGIGQWWLADSGISASDVQVRQALGWLVARGLAARHRLPGGTVVYGRAGAPPFWTGALMANYQAVHSVANSIVTFLNNTYPPQMDGVDTPECTFSLVSSGELTGTYDGPARVTLYLYRVTVNEHTRQQRPPAMSPEQLAPMGLDLHFMLSAWASTALAEQVPLTWAMRQLYLHPLLDASSLSPEARWGPDEVIQIIPAELPTEDMMRIWDALEPAYRLSVSYIARMVRIDPDAIVQGRPVVATRLVHGTASPAGAGGA